jgi:hypothetical protein
MAFASAPSERSRGVHGVWSRRGCDQRGMAATLNLEFGGRRLAPRKDVAIREHETYWRRASRVHGSRRPSVGLASPAQTRRTVSAGVSESSALFFFVALWLCGPFLLPASQ